MLYHNAFIWMLHIWMRYVTHMNVTHECYTYECITLINALCYTSCYITTHLYECYTSECVILHLMLYHNAFISVTHSYALCYMSRSITFRKYRDLHSDTLQDTCVHMTHSKFSARSAYYPWTCHVTHENAFYHIQKVPRSAFGPTPRHMCEHDSFKIQRQIRVLPLNVSCYTYECVVSHSESTEICVNMTHSKFSARSAYYPSTCHVTHTNALYHIQKVPRSAFGPSKIDVWTSRCVNMIHPKESSTLSRIHPSSEFWMSHVHTCVLECVLIHPKESRTFNMIHPSSTFNMIHPISTFNMIHPNMLHPKESSKFSCTWDFWYPDSTSAKSIACDALQQNH